MKHKTETILSAILFVCSCFILYGIATNLPSKSFVEVLMKVALWIVFCGTLSMTSLMIYLNITERKK